MLDADTKARIDSARDILVGKVPDPKSQVEQITIALIYKFMDDMDRQSEELGGKATFFTGDFKKYRWANLLDKRLGGHERLLLYAEGIEKMNENRNIPQLFRDIFKGVFLPYRDPETLNLFLKEIAGFSYDHSERLGDAFEYLLSVLGTQGDAGQFRTPRHVIDFIVTVVDPKKHETVLDPACGTAGFLVSAYKHILRNNENLTPDERARLMTNFRGYDIAPDMVRLSRANLYLHGFPNPVIHEYDTLTSEERWDERCDVILANPPFMSPKGGIRPHNRFSIKAKRSEVLFVDYMAEHLNPGGRAGIIVPEGIIFQSQNAYKALRKMLVENYLWAVVSLPAGVFNPYSGVKTSLLFLDRNLARRTDELLFVKVETDGFDLGAQRRPNGKNDLPEAIEILDGHKKEQKTQESKMVLTVSRKRLLESGDISFSSDRYRKAAAVQSKWPLVKLGEVCKLEKGASFTRAQAKSGNVPVIAGGQVPSCYHAEANHQPPVITVSASGAYAGFVNYFEVPIFATDCTTIVSLDEQKVKTRFVFEILKGKQEAIYDVQKGMAQPHVYAKDLIAMEIPLPPLAEQERIVAELDGYRKIIEGTRQVIANYKPTIKIDPTWPMLELSDIAMMKRGPFGGSLKKEIFVQTGYKVYEQKHAIQKDISIGTYFINKQKFDEMQEFAVAPGDIIISCSGTMGRVYILPLDAPKGIINQALLKVTIDRDKTLAEYVELILSSEEVQSKYFRDTSGAAIQNVASMKEMRAIPIPLPPLDIQREIVAAIETERSLVDVNRKLVEIFEKKIQAKLAEIWGKE